MPYSEFELPIFQKQYTVEKNLKDIKGLFTWDVSYSGYGGIYNSEIEEIGIFPYSEWSETFIL